VETLLPLTLPPGFWNNGTEYQAKGRWADGDLVRFHNGTIRPVGGWVARTLTGDAVSGVPRGAIAWTPDVNGTDQAPVLAYGTTTGLFVETGGVRYDITPLGLGTDADRVWSLTVFGNYLVAVAWNPTDYTRRKGPFVWTGDVTAEAQLLAAAPESGAGVVATDERFLFLLQGVDPLGPDFAAYPDVPSTRTVLWASQETLTDWTPTAENSAGSFPLNTDGALLAGTPLRGQTLLFTTTDVHRATYIGGEFVYRFEQAGADCGLVAPRAFGTTDVAAYWMGPRGFYVYDGYVKRLPCEVEDKVFGELNRSRAHGIWCLMNPIFGEVTWFYPAGSSQECTRSVTYNYVEGHWRFDTLARSCGVTVQPPGVVPVMLDSAAVVYDHETGTARGGATPYLESGPIELGSGDRTMRVQAVIPDEKTLGQVALRLYGRLYPMGAETEYGPFTLTARTDVRMTAREVRVRLTEATASDWRVGVVRLGVLPGGFR